MVYYYSISIDNNHKKKKNIYFYHKLDCIQVVGNKPYVSI